MMGQSQGDKYALLELAHLPPEMNKEEFARAWTQIVKRYQPATNLYHGRATAYTHHSTYRDMPRAHRQYVASRQATINNCKVRPPAVLLFMIARIRPPNS